MPEPSKSGAKVHFMILFILSSVRVISLVQFEFEGGLVLAALGCLRWPQLKGQKGNSHFECETKWEQETGQPFNVSANIV